MLFSVFSQNWQRFIRSKISDQQIRELVDDGTTQIDITKHAQKAKNILAQDCHRYTQELPKIFASNSKYFKEIQFQIELETDLKSTP